MPRYFFGIWNLEFGIWCLEFGILINFGFNSRGLPRYFFFFLEFEIWCLEFLFGRLPTNLWISYIKTVKPLLIRSVFYVRKKENKISFTKKSLMTKIIIIVVFLSYF